MLINIIRQTLLTGLDEVLSVIYNLHTFYDAQILNSNVSSDQPCFENRSAPGRPKKILDEQQIILHMKTLNMYVMEINCKAIRKFMKKPFNEIEKCSVKKLKGIHI